MSQLHQTMMEMMIESQFDESSSPSKVHLGGVFRMHTLTQSTSAEELRKWLTKLGEMALEIEPGVRSLFAEPSNDHGLCRWMRA